VWYGPRDAWLAAGGVRVYLTIDRLIGSMLHGT